MKVLVLGAGVIGVTAAYELAGAGHDVTVVDRQAAPALETSFANAGEVSPGYSAPWAGPGVPLKAIKWLAMHHRPLVIRPHVDAAFIGWVLAMLRNCTAARYDINKTRMVRLAEYSRDCLRALRAETGIAYDERMQGTLQLFRTQAQFDGSASDIAVLRQSGVAFELLDRAGCIRHEPALSHVDDKFVGGLLLPGDETGDCFKFTQRLAALACARGVQFRFGTNLRGIVRSGARIDGVAGDSEMLKADAYLVALGSYSPLLLRPIGIRIPVYPVKGYSITVPIVDASGAPESTVMDRDAQGGGHAAGRPDPRRRHGRARGLYAEAAPCAARYAHARRQRSVSERWRRQPRGILVRPAPDDARRHAGDRRDADRKSVPGHRSWDAGLDDGRGDRAGDGRCNLGPQRRHRPDGLDDGALRARLALTRPASGRRRRSSSARLASGEPEAQDRRPRSRAT